MWIYTEKHAEHVDLHWENCDLTGETGDITELGKFDQQYLIGKSDRCINI